MSTPTSDTDGQHRWGLTPLGVASSLVMLVCIYWMAGPSRPGGGLAAVGLTEGYAKQINLLYVVKTDSSGLSKLG